ncbi:MAG: DNA translocase FtsK, partial [Oscillospiraceae bacterium]|nr:DNA translocase FtsK [Oscillospiraceae bacterium]
PITLLDQNAQDNYIEAGAELNTNARRLADTLRSFGVDATAGDVVRGPAITRYEFVLDQGVKLSKVTNLADDIALALGASGVRIAPIPDKISVVGIEVPNKAVSPVLIRDVIESQEFVNQKSSVAFAVGRDIGNRNIIGDIAKLPHVLIAGTTGSGKSVCTNSLIISLLYKSSPEDVRFIMVDPKMVELAPYNGIPHLLIPVVTDPKKAAGALQWAVYEMMKRYKAFSEVGVKKLEEYNALARQREDLQHMASVVVVIDELADLMLVAAKEVEESICRVAQMGRAAGMHLVIATQRPSADVITGLMKANIPSRIAFAVASSLESRIILDATGAEKLVGRGDMLYSPLGGGKPQRVQGCFITPEEIERVVSFVKSTGEAQYSDEIIQKIEESMQERDKKGGAQQGGGASAGGGVESDGADELLDAAVEVILETGQASVSMLQRRLKLGYSRAARLVDQMEERGYVGPFEGSKPRQLLISKERWQEMKIGSREEEAPPAVNYSEHVIPWEEQE